MEWLRQKMQKQFRVKCCTMCIFNGKYVLLLIVVLLSVVSCVFPELSSSAIDQSEEFLRSKRQINSIPLVYPYGGTYKLLVGIALPIENKEKVALLLAANFQFQYLQFQNISDLSQYYFIKEVSREQRDADAAMRRDERLVFYRSMTDMLSFKGFNGQECMLRAICEAAQYPVEEEGFVGEILHVLLTPDYGKTPFDDLDPEWEGNMSPYIDAAIAGRQMFSCVSIYSGCPEGQGLLELISYLRDE